MSSSIYEEVEIEDMIYIEETQLYSFPCPCGDRYCNYCSYYNIFSSLSPFYRFIISLEELLEGEDIAHCPSCTLRIKVIYDIDKLPALLESVKE